MKIYSKAGQQYLKLWFRSYKLDYVFGKVTEMQTVLIKEDFYDSFERFSSLETNGLVGQLTNQRFTLATVDNKNRELVIRNQDIRLKNGNKIVVVYCDLAEGANDNLYAIFNLSTGKKYYSPDVNQLYSQRYFLYFLPFLIFLLAALIVVILPFSGRRLWNIVMMMVVPSFGLAAAFRAIFKRRDIAQIQILLYEGWAYGGRYV